MLYPIAIFAGEPVLVVGDHPGTYQAPSAAPIQDHWSKQAHAGMTQQSMVDFSAKVVHRARTTITPPSSQRRSNVLPAAPASSEHAADVVRTSEIADATAQFFGQWKAKYVRSGFGSGRYYVHVNPDNSPDSGFDADTLTVSEAHGYGMLIMARIGAQDPEARRIFDGMYLFFKDHPSNIDSRLMAWKVLRSGRSVDDGDSATDGDMDIAYALIQAHERWGSTGSVNYLRAAQDMLRAIREKNIHPTANTILFGDWAAGMSDNERLKRGTRTSDMMLDHFRVFNKYDPSPVWQRVIDKSQQLLKTMQTDFSPQHGLIPDFIEDAVGNNPRPAQGTLLESPNDGSYGYNATRVPMRVGVDALFNKDAASRDIVLKINDGIRRLTGGDPARLASGYTLDGRPLNPWTGDMAFLAPLVVSAMVMPNTPPPAPQGLWDPFWPSKVVRWQSERLQSQIWFVKLWKQMVETPLSSQSYFGNTLKMMSMLVVSGNYRS